jgi:hypothetical protein
VHLTDATPFPVVERKIGEQMEQHLEDYLYVSTYLGYEQRWDRESLLPFANALALQRGWDDARVNQEISGFTSANR